LKFLPLHRKANNEELFIIYEALEECKIKIKICSDLCKFFLTNFFYPSRLLLSRSLDEKNGKKAADEHEKKPESEEKSL
jgi:hypothetical protein